MVNRTLCTLNTKYGAANFGQFHSMTSPFQDIAHCKKKRKEKKRKRRKKKEKGEKKRKRKKK